MLVVAFVIFFGKEKETFKICIVAAVFFVSKAEFAT